MSEGYDASDNAAVVRRWFEEVWNRGRAEAIDELFDEQGVAHGLTDETGAELRGPAHFRSFQRGFREAFPDIEVVVEDTVSEGDKVAARCSVRGRHRGDSLGIKATDNRVEFDGICIVRVRGGKIVEAWNSFDFMSMFRQLGALRIEAAPTAPDDSGKDDALPSMD
jgi:steroid delta-isomerase-like uncharacterized protein